MMKEQPNKKIDALSMFPDLFRKDLRPQPRRKTLPPPPPDLSWLWKNEAEKGESDENADLVFALILVPEPAVAESISTVLEKLGYQGEIISTALEAIHRLLTGNYAVIVMHIGFESDKSLEKSTVHMFLNQLPMSKRRMIYYILMGPDFHTLYNLQALACSANLVINDSHVEKFEIILRKGLRDYEESIAPLLPYLNS